MESYIFRKALLKLNNTIYEIGSQSEIIVPGAESILNKTAGPNYVNNRVSFIGGNRFASCNNLVRVELQNCQMISEYAFTSCSNLKTVIIPNCKSFGSQAFMNCSNLQTISLSTGNLSIINSQAFMNCSNLENFLESITCDIIGYSAFLNCNKLSKINWICCSTISNYAFYNTKLSNITIENITNLGNSAFASCSNLETVCFVGLNNLSIGSGAFMSCSNLTNISLDNCTFLSTNAFFGCNKLTSINLPKCSQIGTQAFRNCTKLSQITLGNSSICKLTQSNIFLNAGITSSTGSIYVPSSLIANYQVASYWSYFSNIFFPISNDEEE